MASGPFLFCAHGINAPVKKDIESLARIFFVEAPVTFNEAFELGKNFFDWVEAR